MEKIADPTFVEIFEEGNDEDSICSKKVYVTVVSGQKTLDLYSGWDPATGAAKSPLSILPKEVCQISSLNRLWASHNSFSSLPPEIDQLMNLTELFLHHNKLDKIPTRLCTLVNLRLLWLNNNRITHVPYEVVQLTSLKRLHLDHNRITEFSPHLCKLSNLEVLYLNNNKVLAISSGVNEMTSLTKLYLNNNQIVQIPHELCVLFCDKMKLLRLDNNRISKIPEQFAYFRKMAEDKRVILKFDNNPFETRKVSPTPYTLPLKEEQPERRHSYSGKGPIEPPKQHRPSMPAKIYNPEESPSRQRKAGSQ